MFLSAGMGLDANERKLPTHRQARRIIGNGETIGLESVDMDNDKT